MRYGDNSDAHARALHDILSDANVRQNVTDATHNRGNVLHFVITASSSSPITRVSVDDLVTDHFAVLCDLITTKARPPRKKITYRRYAAIDNFNFTKDLCECDFITQPACDKYYTELSCLVDRHAPLVQRNVTERPRTPWWCQELGELKRQVRLLERTWRRSRTDDHRISYTNLRGRYCRPLASTKAAFYSKEIESASNDNRAMFRIANHLLGRKCMNGFPNDTVGPDAVADSFAYHFANKITSIRSQIQRPSADVDNAQPCTVSSPLLAFQPASLEEVTTLIENGKTQSSTIDPLPIAILKANISILAPILRNVINLSYESSTVPARLKHAVVTPLLKRSGLPVDDYASYRPISKLSYASKILERHVSAQLRLHLQHNKIGDPFQSAYRPSHSVETAIVNIQDDILRSLGTRKLVVLVLLDLSAAFDTIDHELLLAELDRIGVRGDALCWLAS